MRIGFRVLARCDHIALILAALLPVAIDAAPVKRALLVGINQYRTTVGQEPVPAPADRVPLLGRATHRHWSDLDGAINDVDSMYALLVGRFGFDPKNIVVLKDSQATAAAILSALRRTLVDVAQPGDIGLFYYAGHGSRIRNTRTNELSGYDQTIVPADAPAGAPDIRDKELARIFRSGIQKGALLTAIFDSCHSGSIARGEWSAGGKIRQLEPDARFVEDPPDLDSSGAPLPDPEASGMLVLSAAQDFETAAEIETESGPHGLFTWAMVRVLQSSAPGERISVLFEQIRAMMQADGSLQEPVLAGKNRGSKSLLGEPTSSDNRIFATVTGMWNGIVRLDRGAGIGLNPGCELRQREGHSRLRILRTTGLSSSEAAVEDGSAAAIHAGSVYELDRWTAPAGSVFKIYAPRSEWSARELRQFAAELAGACMKNGVQWVEDPIATLPTHILSWSNGSWTIEQYPRHAPLVRLGARPSPPDVLRALRPITGARLFLCLPLAEETARTVVHATEQNTAVALVADPGQAQYRLAGRFSGDHTEYAWLLTAAVADRTARMTPLPVQSNWVRTGRELADTAFRLARLHRWLTLSAPANRERFPYYLNFQDVATGAISTGSETVGGQRYKLVMRADAAALRAAVNAGTLARRWIYVFAVDSNGESKLVFPRPSRGNVETRFPTEDDPPEQFPLTGDERDFEVGPPFGTDTFFALTSDDPLPSPEVLEFAPVRTRGERHPLTLLLADVSEPRREAVPAVPLNWSLERISVRSVPAR
jgi:hypothetical protein